MVALEATVAEGMDTVSEFVVEHPVAVMVSVSLYMVVAEGLTDGFEAVELNPDGELVQE